MTDHRYKISLAWDGSTGAGYRGYDRSYRLGLADTSIEASADAPFLGNATLPNPEHLLLAAASACQMLSFLALAARAGIDVVQYDDDAHAVMPKAGIKTRITAIDLHVRLTVRGSGETEIERLMHEAHEQCFIANTLNAEITLHTEVEVIV